MQIHSTGFIQVSEKFGNISTILWDNDIQHQTYCVEQDGQLSHIEFECDLNSIKVLLKIGWINKDEFDKLVDVDYTTIY